MQLCDWRHKIGPQTEGRACSAPAHGRCSMQTGSRDSPEIRADSEFPASVSLPYLNPSYPLFDKEVR